ncbi:MAG: SprT-like domain-containing protein [candidate division WOR-3 bacterium]
MEFENIKNFLKEVETLLQTKTYFFIDDFYKDLKKIVEKSTKKKAREELQKLANEIFNEYKLLHIPVYLSDKYKIRVAGRFFVERTKFTKRTRRMSIVVFYLKSEKYYPPYKLEKINLKVFPLNEIIDTLMHEIAHYIAFRRYNDLGHGILFEKEYAGLMAKYYSRIKSNPYPTYEEAKEVMEEVVHKIVEKAKKDVVI